MGCVSAKFVYTLVHLTQTVQQVLAKHHILHVHQPPYSQDMAPSHFFALKITTL